MDELTALLDQAAGFPTTPDVDGLLERGDRRRRKRRLATGVLAATVLVLATVAVSLANRSAPLVDPVGSTTGDQPHATTGPAEFLAVRQLGTGELDAIARIEHTDVPRDIVDLWSRFSIDGPVPAIDLSEELVLIVVTPDDGCVDELAGFSMSGEAIVPIFTQGGSESDEECEQELVGRAHAVAVRRMDLGPEHIVRLPASTTGSEDFDAVEHVIVPRGIGIDGALPEAEENPPAGICARSYSLDAVADSASVIDATIGDVVIGEYQEEAGARPVTWTVHVHEWLVGSGPRTIEVASWGGENEDPGRVAGERFLLASATAPGPRLDLPACGFSRPWNVADAEAWRAAIDST